MTIKKKLLLSSFLILFFLFLWNLNLIVYGASQLKGQVAVLVASEDISVVLKEKSFPDSLKHKLRLVQDIKRFAIDSIGLTNSNSYETVFNQEGKPILKIITACKPFDLEDYTWSFPLLGEVSYKGFFNEQMLNEEVEKIRENGYDVSINEVTAWSTLGWFKDPILTNFLRRQDGMLANLIIHELTHGTIYIKSNVYFNENLANFIGNEGAKYYLKSTFGDSSTIYKEYVREMNDEQVLSHFVVMKADELDSLYQTFDSKISLESKKEIKHQFMLSYINDLKLLPINNVIRYTPNIDKLNNTYFQSFRRYNSNLKTFELDYKKQNNLSDYIEHIKSLYE
jgi:predicted aminopeptidase